MCEGRCLFIEIIQEDPEGGGGGIIHHLLEALSTSEISPPDSLCTFFDRPKFRDETGFYMHNPRHPRASEWAARLEEIYLTGEVWTYAKDRAADQYTMAHGRDSFRDCKQMDLMKYHEGVDPKDPVPTSPLNRFLQHLKGDKKQS